MVRVFNLFCTYPFLYYLISYILVNFVQAAIISLGLIGAGTNNARIAGMLRNLSSYYYKEAAHLFCVSISHNDLLASSVLAPCSTLVCWLCCISWLCLLCSSGENCSGSCSPWKRLVDPFSIPFWPVSSFTVSDYLWTANIWMSLDTSILFLFSFGLSRMALGGLVTVLHACLDMKSTILGKYHYILYIIVLAMQVCFNNQLPLHINEIQTCWILWLNSIVLVTA